MCWIWLIKSAVATYDQMQWTRTKKQNKKQELTEVR